MSRPDGGPAFPALPDDRCMEGMTLRDYFAAKAMQSAITMLAGHRFYNEAGFFSELAKSAYEMADAMLAERSKP